MPVIIIEAAVVRATQDLRVVVAESETEDAEAGASWRSEGQLQVVLICVRGEADLVKVLTPGGVHQPVSSMTHGHVQH